MFTVIVGYVLVSFWFQTCNQLPNPPGESFFRSQAPGRLRRGVKGIPHTGSGGLPWGEDLEREIGVFRERLSHLSEASLRISESLEFQTALPGVLDRARVLTEGRCGVITILDDAGNWGEESPVEEAT